ncbi:DMT family transporter [Ramlibacter sp. H39-3-26]|uniref:DMT family transporter n=1 Tax=Curvibacter soli TaxID=3031331 RepID=UPI0023DA0270|nr:DMT family transporter [Ramlibacter sp. H39-3-26]MDF1486596.1 DMT family transporter [Ramlibacter sp. H39-3-26]
MPRLTQARAVWLMVAVTLMWSIAGVVTPQLEAARSFEVTFWRSAWTALALLVVLPLAQGRAAFAALAHGGGALWLSGLCWGAMFTAFMVALTRTSVAHVLVTMAIGPLMTALFARAIIGHRIAARTWGAIAVAGLGIAWIYGTQLGSGSLAGTLIALCVPVTTALNWTLVQHAATRGRQVSLAPAVLLGAVLSALATLPLALPLAASARDIAWLALLGLVQLAIPCVLAVRCARELPAPEMALLALLEVIFGILWAWVGAGERPAPTVLGGGALVVGALVFNAVTTSSGKGADK